MLKRTYKQRVRKEMLWRTKQRCLFCGCEKLCRFLFKLVLYLKPVRQFGYVTVVALVFIFLEALFVVTVCTRHQCGGFTYASDLYCVNGSFSGLVCLPGTVGVPRSQITARWKAQKLDFQSAHVSAEERKQERAFKLHRQTAFYQIFHHNRFIIIIIFVDRFEEL